MKGVRGGDPNTPRYRAADAIACWEDERGTASHGTYVLPAAVTPAAKFAGADEFISKTCGAEESYLVLGEGTFRARFTRIRLGQIVVHGAEEALARVARVALAPTWARIAFHTADGLSSVCAGEELSYGQVVLHGPGSRHHHRTQGPLQWGSVMMPSTLFAALAGGGAAAGAAMLLPREGHAFFTPPPEALRRLIEFHRAMLRLTETEPNISTQEDVAAALGQTMMRRVAECLRPSDGGHGSVWSRRAQLIVNRLEAMLAAENAEPVNMADIGAALGVAGRTLRSCCQKILGISPGRYVRMRRLYMARHSLVTSDPEKTSVTEIALRHGFFEFGRFAGVYRSEFGESPSMTLRRLRPSPLMRTHMR